MPKEHKKRGRREEKKRKDPEEQEYSEQQSKRPRQSYPYADGTVKLDTEKPYEYQYGSYPAGTPDDHTELERSHQYSYEESTAISGDAEAGPTTFYGLLDEDELAYFKSADQTLEANLFADAEEKGLFISSVWREANGNELKLANTQSCSRFLEKIIRLSSPAQLKSLFAKFSGHFLPLIQHRFASHCCEALFITAAPRVTEELVAPENPAARPSADEESSMEELFLGAIKELEGTFGFLMTNRFASHTLRVLVSVLSGRSLTDASTTAIIQSKRKESNKDRKSESRDAIPAHQIRPVPSSFGVALDAITSGTIGELDLKTLATHPIGNPVLQLLLEIEFAKSKKDRAKQESPISQRLLPDLPPTPDSPTASFIRYLLYDQVGSHLLETIVNNCPGSMFKSIYRSMFRHDLASMVKNETASYVVIRILERLGKEDLEHSLDQLLPEFPMLLSRSRTTVIKTLVERSRVRGIDTKAVGTALKSDGNDCVSLMLVQLLAPKPGNTKESSDGLGSQIDAQQPNKRHITMLLQSMLSSPDHLRDIVNDALLEQADQLADASAANISISRLIQAFLTCDGQPSTIRRKFLNEISEYATLLATNPIGSHVMDAVWPATDDLQFIRERFASELVRNESTVRDTFSGRGVWRNWMMDLYKTRRSEWKSKCRERMSLKDPNAQTKTPIEVARERYAAKKLSTGANAKPPRVKPSVLAH